jgi:hypothetical protein
MKAVRSGGLGERRLEIFSNKTPTKVNISLKSEIPKWKKTLKTKWRLFKICVDNQMLLTFTKKYILIHTTS